MPRESVVDALNVIYRALRRGGVILDVHPLAAPCPLELRSADSSTTLIGQTEYSAEFSHTIALAEQSLTQQEVEGRLTNEQHTDFPTVHHFATADSWARFRAKNAQDFVPVSEDLVANVGQALTGPDTVLLMTEPARATRYHAKP
jgi:hypothetical protein